MSIKHLAAGVAATTFSVVAGAATAATMSATFDLTCSFGSSDCTYGLQSSFSVEDNGVTADISGGAFNPLQAADVGRYGGGVGVTNGSGDSHQTDGSGKNDFVNIALSRVASITQLLFTHVDGNDHFFLLNDNDNSNSVSGGDSFGTRTSVASTVNLTTALNDFFAIAALDTNDNWKLKAVTVSWEETTPVPLPAAGWLLLAGVGGLAGMRRRNKKA